MVTDEMVEKAARAMCEAWHYSKIGTPDGDAEWRKKQDQYRKQSRAALEAALSAAEPVDYQLVFSDGRTSRVLYSKDEAERFKKASDITVDIRALYAAPPAPSVAKSLESLCAWLLHRFGPNSPEGREASWRMPALSAQVQDVAESEGAKAIAAERRRQIEQEGWTPQRDDQYLNGELLQAAACYALHDGGVKDIPPPAWPWSDKWWKPSGVQRDLEKAGALIAAEIDRRLRAAAPAKQEG